MPILPTFTAKLGGGAVGGVSGGRRASAEDFGGDFGDAGRRIQAAAQGFLQDTEESEARKALVESTAIRARYAKQLDEAAISGADLTSLKEKMDGELAKVGEGFQTKKGVESLSIATSNTHLMYDQQANQIAVQRAWAEAKTQVGSIVKNSSVIVAANPAALTMEVQSATDFIKTFPGLRPDQKIDQIDRVTKDLNGAVAMASARNDPAGTIKRLEAGEWDLEPEQRRQAIGAAEHYKNVRLAAEDRERSRVKEERRDAAITARGDYTQQILSGNLSKQLENKIIRDPAFAAHPEFMEHLVTFMRADAKRRAGEEKQSDARVKKDLYLSIIAPEGTPGKIYDSTAIYNAVKVGTLSSTDASTLIGMVAGQKDVNGRAFSGRLHERMTILGRSMNDSAEYKNQPELTATIQMRLAGDIQRQSEQMRAAGKSPDGLLDDTSPDFFFKPGRLKATDQAVRRDMAALAPQTVDLRKTPEAARTVEVGQPFVDPNGVTRTMTKELKDRLSAAPAAGAAPAATSSRLEVPGVTSPFRSSGERGAR